MAYLDPPPFPAPVIVMKDVGGFVAEYQAQTARFRQEGREVRVKASRPSSCVHVRSALLLRGHLGAGGGHCGFLSTLQQTACTLLPWGVWGLNGPKPTLAEANLGHSAHR